MFMPGKRDSWKCVIGILLLAATAHAQRQTKPEIWICPNGQTAANLFTPDDDWPNVRSHITGIKLYIDWINAADPAVLRRVAALQTTHGLKVTLECGGTVAFAGLDQSNGVNAAKLELNKMLKLYQAGGWVDYLDIDGPIRRLLWPNLAGTQYNGFRRSQFTVATAAKQLMNYLHAVKTMIASHYPDHPIQFNLLTNFANWGYRGGPSYHNRTRGDGKQIMHAGNTPPYGQDNGDYYDALMTVLNTAKSDPRGLKLAGLTVDIPFDYIMGFRPTPTRTPLWQPASVDWFARVRDLERVVRRQGLAFNLIVNSERGGEISDERFYTDTLMMARLYQASGGRPDAYRVQSWYPHPVNVGPETKPHTLTALAQAITTLITTASPSSVD